MPKFRKKPVVIEAVQWTGHSVNDVDGMLSFDDWMVANQGDRQARYVGATVVIPTLEGEMTATIGDWIIKGVKGEIYPCKPDIFEATYEPAD